MNHTHGRVVCLAIRVCFSALNAHKHICVYVKRSRLNREVRIEGIRVKNQPMQIMWRQTRRKPLSDRGETLGVWWELWGTCRSFAIRENCAFLTLVSRYVYLYCRSTINVDIFLFELEKIWIRIAWRLIENELTFLGLKIIFVSFYNNSMIQNVSRIIKNRCIMHSILWICWKNQTNQISK